MARKTATTALMVGTTLLARLLCRACGRAIPEETT